MEENKLKRRSFLKLAGAALAGMSLPFKSRSADAQISTNLASSARFWKTNPANGLEYLQQTVVNTKFVHSDNIIWGKVDGWWQKYQLAEYDQEFLDWWVNDTFKWYELIFSTPSQPIPNGGHHTPGIATYSRRGVGRGDSSFHLNSAFKSITIIPKLENIDEYLSVYEQALAYNAGTSTNPGPYNLDWKKAKLKDSNYWDRRLLGMVDLYSGRDFVEQTFGFKESHYLLNTMVNPVANVLFLDTWTQSAAPTWEFRGIVANTHWNDPNKPNHDPTQVSDDLYQKYLKCVILPHKLQHGQDENFIGVVMHVVEQFDNRDSDAMPGRGVRIVPSFNYLASHFEYSLKKMVGKV